MSKVSVSLEQQILDLEVSYGIDDFYGLSDWATFEAGIVKGLEAASLLVGQKADVNQAMLAAARAAHSVIVGDLVQALEMIVDRSRNGELGTSKVIDMRVMAEKALKSVSRVDTKPFRM